MTFFWVYNQKSKTPSDGTCLGEPLGGFCDVGYHLHFLVALHLSFFFILILFSTSSLTLPWTIARFLDPFWTSSPAHCRVIHNTFIFNHSVIFLPRVATVLSGHFLPTGIFYLTLLPDIFGTNCFYEGFPGSRQLFLEICRASYWSSKHKPGPSVCLIHSNPLSYIHLKFLFIHVNIAKVFTCGENFDKKYRSVATPFSSHENIKQQPN